MTTVGDIYEALDALAPFDTAESWDNVGLLAGSRRTEVTTVVTALDITSAVAAFAAGEGAQLIVSHHPVIFSPLKQLEAGSAPWKLAEAGIAAICAHTNLDSAAGGVNDLLADRLNLSLTTVAGDGLCRIGELPESMAPERFAAYVQERLGCRARFAAGPRPVRVIGICGGAGGDYLAPLWERYRLDGLLTGELKHHEWIELAASGATVVEAGHYHTEVLAAEGLAAYLSVRFPNLRFLAAKETSPYRTL